MKKTKATSYLSVILTALVLSACGGGGGGGSTTSPSNGGGDSGGDNGGGNGGGNNGGGSANASYYGFATDSATPLRNISSTTASATIANQFSLNVRNDNDRLMDVLVYQPACIEGLLEYTFSAVMVDGSDSSPTFGVIKVSANGAKFQARAVLNDATTIHDVGAERVMTGSCSNGELDLGVDGKIFSTDKLALWRTGTGDLYVAGRSSDVETVMANFHNKQYNKYLQLDNNTVHPTSRLTTYTGGNSGGFILDDSAGSSDSAIRNNLGTTTIAGFTSDSNPNSQYHANTNGHSSSTAQHTRIWDGLAANVPYYGFGLSNIGGKSLIVQAMQKSNTAVYGTSTNGSTTVNQVLGSGSVLFYIQQ